MKLTSIANWVRPAFVGAAETFLLALLTASGVLVVPEHGSDTAKRLSKSPLALSAATKSCTVAWPFTNRTVARLPLVSTRTSMSSGLDAI